MLESTAKSPKMDVKRALSMDKLPPLPPSAADRSHPTGMTTAGDTKRRRGLLRLFSRRSMDQPDRQQATDSESTIKTKPKRPWTRGLRRWTTGPFCPCCFFVA